MFSFIFFIVVAFITTLCYFHDKEWHIPKTTGKEMLLVWQTHISFYPRRSHQLHYYLHQVTTSPPVLSMPCVLLSFLHISSVNCIFLFFRWSFVHLLPLMSIFFYLLMWQKQLKLKDIKNTDLDPKVKNHL